MTIIVIHFPLLALSFVSRPLICVLLHIEAGCHEEFLEGRLTYSARIPIYEGEQKKKLSAHTWPTKYFVLCCAACTTEFFFLARNVLRFYNRLYFNHIENESTLSQECPVGIM